MASTGKLALAIFAVGILGLAIALFAPAALDPTVGNVTQTVNATEGEDIDLTDTLRVTVNDVEDGGDTVNATLRSLRTHNSSQVTVDEGNTTNTTVDGDTLHVTTDSVESNTDAIITVEYPPVFGWDSGPRTFIENMDTILIIVVGSIAIAGLGALVKET